MLKTFLNNFVPFFASATAIHFVKCAYDLAPRATVPHAVQTCEAETTSCEPPGYLVS
jgi:hypothetical protein